MNEQSEFDQLVTYPRRVPSVSASVGSGRSPDGNWWAKFSIDIAHPLAWHVVQEFGCVLSYLSVNERLPTVFMPVTPAPYLNGGPAEFLSWVIESTDPAFTPAMAAEWLEGRLPRPVDDLEQWELDDEESGDA